MWEKNIHYMSDHSPASVFKPLILKPPQNTYKYPVFRKKSRNNGLPLLLFEDSSMWSSCDAGHEVSMREGKDVWEELYYEGYLAKDWFLEAIFMFIWLYLYLEKLRDVSKRKTDAILCLNMCLSCSTCIAVHVFTTLGNLCVFMT